MRITVFGATGKTGRLVVQQALTQGYDVVAFARTPSKLGMTNPKLSVVQGDLHNPADVERAIEGADAVISVLGPSSNAPDLAVSRGMRNILTAMQRHDVKRLIVSTGAGVRQPGDQPRLPDQVIGGLLKIVSRNVLQDMVDTVNLVKNSDREWTIVRVPMLTDEPAAGNLRAGAVGKDIGVRLRRADLAAFLLRQLKETEYLKRAPAVSN